MLRPNNLAVTLVVATLFPVGAWAATITIPTDYALIQAGLDAASPGDTVRVLAGVYAGPGNRDLSFGGKDLVVLGAGSDITIIDCEGGSASPHRGFDFRSGETAAAVLEGFTIRNGFSVNWSGGINCRASSPTIRNCAIEDCSAQTFGGGIGTWNNASPQIRECRIARNSAGTDGGGIGITGASASLSACEIVDNQYAEWGGGIYLSAGELWVDGCTIGSNWGGSSGGGIAADGFTLEVRDTDLFGNESSVSGGAAAVGSGGFLFERIVVAGNRSYLGGGLTIGANSAGEIRSSTVAGNVAAADGGGIYISADDLSVYETIVWGNCAPEGAEAYLNDNSSGPVSTPFSCSAIDTTAIGGPGSIDFVDDFVVAENPLFCRPILCEEVPSTVGMFTIGDASPCLPENNSCGVLIGARGQGCIASSVAERPLARSPVLVFPSPLRRSDTLHLRLVQGDRRADVYDTGGRLVAHLFVGSVAESGTAIEVSFEDQVPKSGVYFVRVEGLSGVRSSRVIVVD